MSFGVDRTLRIYAQVRADLLSSEGSFVSTYRLAIGDVLYAPHDRRRPELCTGSHF